MIKRDLRGNLIAKCAAILLLVISTAFTLVFGGVVIAQSYGYGAYNSYEEDPLFLNNINDAMLCTLNQILEPSGYSAARLSNLYAGFSAQVYDGEPAEGGLVGVWSDIPQEPAYQTSSRIERSSAETGYYTVVGFLREDIPVSSVFQRDLSLYQFIHSFHYGGTAVITVLSLLTALAMLIFLLCAAGHRASQNGIFPNWQDRVPLDLYLVCVVILLVVVLVQCDQVLYSNRYAPLLIYIAPLVLSFLAAGSLLLASLLTLATRFKLGKWWRNTICYGIFRWCRNIWWRCWTTVMEFVRILPMTWRTVLAVGGVLLLQSFLILVIFLSYDGAFFLPITLLLDIVLVAGAAWLSRQLQLVKDMGKALAAGDLEAKLDTTKLFWDVKTHAECLNQIGEGMNEAVERRMRSERLKTELITNVSHDIKTPLTSIVNYVDLLKKEALPPAAEEYVMVLDRQSSRLKKLTEDLVEASKASTGNVTVNLEPIVVNEIIHQAVGDYDERLAAGKLEVIVNTYEGNLIALTDGRLLWRVLDNLLSNVCKYAMAGTRVYVDLGTRDNMALLTVKNISRDPLNVTAGELMERFVRGDASRHTEGSGLGLNIARSLMDLMGGSFAVSVDGDLFKAELTLKLVEQKPWEKKLNDGITLQLDMRK